MLIAGKFFQKDNSSSILPPLLNPQFKINYHDKSKIAAREIISKSYDVYERKGLGPHQYQANNYGMKYIDKYGQEQSIVPRGVNLNGVPEELSLQEKIKLINQKNAKLPKIGIKQSLHHPILDKYKDALPQLQMLKPLHESKVTRVKSPIVVSSP